ncbi:MAG: transglutaminase-like domain-containing protein [Lachnospiraceae bacterium]|nr:transglutaminase-like domain-containing protein [Lachnospiraceae bacterium]
MRTIRQEKYFITWMAAVLFFCFVISGTVHAAETRQITKTDNVVICRKDGVAVKDVYVAAVSADNEYKIVKPCTKNSKIYYFNKNGVGTVYKGTGFIKIAYNGKTKTYYSKKGNLLTNQIVGSKKTGYYYVDKTGVKVTDKTVQYAVKFVRAHTKSSDSKETKLKKCYNYLWKNYKYQRVYGSKTSRALNPKAKDMSKISKEMFKSKKGNCHRYASCFAYIARVLGYDSKVAVGSVTSLHGGNTPHGWTLVKYNASGKKYKWYICDPDMEINNVSTYMKETHPCNVTTKWNCTLTIKDGKVTWK